MFSLRVFLVFNICRFCSGPNSNFGFTYTRLGPGVPGPKENPYYIHINILYLFTYIYACFAASAASPAPTHPSIKEAAFGRLHNSGAGASGAPPTVVDSFMDGCVGAGEAADAAKHA